MPKLNYPIIMSEFRNLVTTIEDMVRDHKHGSNDFYTDTTLKSCFKEDEVIVLNSTNFPYGVENFESNLAKALREINLQNKPIVAPLDIPNGFGSHKVGMLIYPNLENPLSPKVYYFDSELEGIFKPAEDFILNIFPQANISVMITSENKQQQSNSHCSTYTIKNLVDYFYDKHLSINLESDIEAVRDNVLFLLEKIAMFHAKAILSYLSDVYKTMENKIFQELVNDFELQKEYERLREQFEDLIKLLPNDLARTFKENDTTNIFNISSLALDWSALQKIADLCTSIACGNNIETPIKSATENEVLIVDYNPDDLEESTDPEKERVFINSLHDIFSKVCAKDNLEKNLKALETELENSVQNNVNQLRNPKPFKLREAFIKDDPELLREWIKENENTTRFKIKLNNAYEEAFKKNKTQFVKVCIEYGMNVNEGKHHLIEVLSRGYQDLALFLLKKDADVNAVDSNNQSPLHVAVMWRLGDPNKSIEIVKRLLEHGANPYAMDDTNETPLDILQKQITLSQNSLEKYTNKNKTEKIKEAQEELKYWEELKQTTQSYLSATIPALI